MTPVSGAAVAPATSAPIPTAAYAPGAEVNAGSRKWTALPNAPPNIAPRKTAGKKLPPGDPDPSVAAVAASLRANVIASAPNASSPARAAFIVSIPVPSTRGESNPKSPTANPPRAARHSGRKRERPAPSRPPVLPANSSSAVCTARM